MTNKKRVNLIHQLVYNYFKWGGGYDIYLLQVSVTIRCQIFILDSTTNINQEKDSENAITNA